MSDTSSFALGIILILLGSIGNNLGNNLVSLGHKNDEKKKLKSKQKKYKHTNKNNKVRPENETSLGQSSNDQLNALEVDKEKKEDEAPNEKNWRRIGVVIFIFGNLFTFASFGFGAQVSCISVWIFDCVS